MPVKALILHLLSMNGEKMEETLKQKPDSEETQSISNNTRIGLLTDIGKKRQVDEDAILAIESMSAFESKSSQKFLLVLADGMGGHSKGEIASKIIVNTIAEKICPAMLSQTNYTFEINKSIQEANQRILQYTSDHPETEGMGSTVVCAVVDGRNVHLANVGDSRIYVISKEEIRRVTKDHSYVQDLVDKGEISEEEARVHPKKNVITKAVGIYSEIKADTMKLTLDDDESLLLCCDGQLIHVEDKEIHEIVVKADEPQEACQKLVDLANERGGEDNISVILLSSYS